MQFFRMGYALVGMVLLLLAAGCSDEKSPKELTVSAAASLADALTEIRTNYESQHRDVKVNFNFGASGALQQQIRQGAPVDLFISAAANHMKALVEEGLIQESGQTTLLSNELVVIVPAEKETAVASLADLSRAKLKHIAIGVPDSVPAGRYAKEALTKAGLWESLQSTTVQGKDVRQVLHYVETGNSDAGFVYRTDALTSARVKIAFTVDPDSHSPIEYPVGIVKTTMYAEVAESFLDYLQSEEASAVFGKYGFIAKKLFDATAMSGR